MASETAQVAPSREAAAQRAVSNTATVREYVESLLVTVILALFGTTFVVQAFKIPSSSMEPTLLVGDHLLVNKFIVGGHGYWYERLLPYREISRGNIIIFKYPYGNHEHYVKRIIGMPGDRVKILDQQVYINGKRLNEPYAFHDPAASYEPFRDNFPPRGFENLEPGIQADWADQMSQYIHNGELVVPPGKYFVMGDNRENSADSRYWGFVDRYAILGRPVIIYWSVQTARGGNADQTFGSWVVSLFDTILHFPSRTRWSRMLHEVH